MNSVNSEMKTVNVSTHVTVQRMEGKQDKVLGKLDLLYSIMGNREDGMIASNSKLSGLP